MNESDSAASSAAATDVSVAFAGNGSPVSAASPAPSKAPSADPLVSRAPDDAPTAARRAAVVVNPTKQANADLRTVFARACQESGWAEPLWLETTAEDPGAGQARQALEDGADVVIAAGGDGTVRAVAGVLAGTETALGLIPLGTGNLLARNLGIEVNDPMRAARQVLTGRVRRIDAVRAVVDGSGAGEVFVVMAGLGFDAAIMAGTRDQLKDRVGWLAYVDAGLRNLPGRPVRARIAVDGQQVAVRRLRGVTAGNCGQLQGGFRMFPDAQPDDGVLDLMTVAPSGRLGWLAVLASLLGRRTSGKTSGGGGKPASGNARGDGAADSGNRGAAIEYFRGGTVEVSLGRAQDVQLDGDYLGQATQLTMTVEPDALAVLVPGN